ncbi:hypothetical protein [Paractinoplanes toevensis]|uniref:Uncharacterized protein n=1 Tax=Paractinoplanes toevensis TaxID=571911 RepID=A0A919TAE2_9ACTN|nr:hypothetical protein [Actinoplanes toevensis]GIM91935.1 hypothetical protein Ato02nite_037280 [Actinoplanes toevensis]
MALSADMLSPAMIGVAAGMVGAVGLAARALKARVVRVVMVVDKNGRVHELPEDDPRISSRL